MKIPVDKSRIPASVSFFDKITSVEIDKEDLFKLGIFKHEVPAKHVLDTDYLYLLSKVSAYIQLYSDFITVNGNQIVNSSTDDRVMKDVSEIVGIALGLKLTIDCFGVRQEKISKIPPPTSKQKYLDYKFAHKRKHIEIETKGTTSKSISKFITDIIEKKRTSTDAYFRFGTVAVLSKPGKSHVTELHLCDDPPDEIDVEIVDDNTPWHYISAFGHILDNKYYNEIVRSFDRGRKPKKKYLKIKERFFGKYEFDGATFFGEFFDYRVNIENIRAVIGSRDTSVEEVFRKVTKAQGKTKIFIGAHSRIVDLILTGKGLKEILSLNFEKKRETSDSGVDIFRDSDGIIVVIASDKIDPQFEEQFSEVEVKNRVGQMVRFQRHEPTPCGSPCRSRTIEGKPCDIKTYRGACHFHR